jgi:hypothetical protein
MLPQFPSSCNLEEYIYTLSPIRTGFILQNQILRLQRHLENN